MPSLKLHFNTTVGPLLHVTKRGTPYTNHTSLVKGTVKVTKGPLLKITKGIPPYNNHSVFLPLSVACPYPCLCLSICLCLCLCMSVCPLSLFYLVCLIHAPPVSIRALSEGVAPRNGKDLQHAKLLRCPFRLSFKIGLGLGFVTL